MTRPGDKPTTVSSADQSDKNPTSLPRDLGLGVTMLDVDYLRGLSLRLWVANEREDEQRRLDAIANRLDEAVREIGMLRDALHLGDEVL